MQQMKTDAVAAGFYLSPRNSKTYRTMQILIIDELLDGKQVDLPPSQDHRTFKKAPKTKKPLTRKSKPWRLATKTIEPILVH